MSLKSYIFGISLLMSQLGNCGVVVGNGGKVVFCEGQTPQVLDTFGTTLADDLAEGGFSSLNDLLDRIALFDRHRSLNLGRIIKDIAANVIEDESRFVTLNDVVDTIPLPEGCKIKIAMVQIYDTSTNRFHYYRNSKIWSSLNVLTRAQVLLHEAIYTDQILFQ